MFIGHFALGESAMFVVGVWVYAKATRARDVVGRRGFAAFVGFLLIAYGAGIGPPPPGITALVITAIAGTAVILLWAWWFDRHRAVET